IFVRAGGAIVRGPRWGDPRQFCASEAEFQDLLAATPSVYGFETAGPRPAEAVARQVRLNQSIGREAIHAELRAEDLTHVAPFRRRGARAGGEGAHLASPSVGGSLAEASGAQLAPEGRPVQVLVSDGLNGPALGSQLRP